MTNCRHQYGLETLHIMSVLKRQKDTRGADEIVERPQLIQRFNQCYFRNENHNEKECILFDENKSENKL